MKNFTHAIADPLGIHARPAGMFAEAAKTWGDAVITVEKDDRTARASRLMKLMGLGVKQGDTVTVAAEGTSEAELINMLHQRFGDPV